ncbi:MAG: 3-deoxy-D-manno-octulosonic-acid transferase, partial [Polaribacter sp.]
MLVFYNIGIRLYHLGVLIASIFNPKAKLWLKGRQGLLEKIEQEVSGHSGETVWVHCASLGEFEMARPIMEGIKNSNSESRIILTFFSPSGYEIRKNYELAEHVFYLPLDTASNAALFVKAIKPTKTIFVKYDLWFHHLNAAKKAGSNLILISAQFRENQLYFKWFGSFGRDALKLFDQIFLVDSNSEKLLYQIDVKSTTVCGDTRYDRVMEISKNAEPIPEIEQFKGEGKLMVCGSTWPEDESLLAKCVESLEETKWLIAPHEVGEENIQRLERLFPDSIRLSLFSNQEAKVVLVDSIGQLNKLYQHADVAYVGGAFKTGLHNMLEATAYGIPTVFGPDCTRFLGAGEMVEKGLAFTISNQSELNNKLDVLLEKNQSQLNSEVLSFMNA